MHLVLSESAERKKKKNYSHTKQEPGVNVLDIFNKLKPRYKKKQFTLHTSPNLLLLHHLLLQ